MTAGESIFEIKSTVPGSLDRARFISSKDAGIDADRFGLDGILVNLVNTLQKITPYFPNFPTLT